MSDVITPNDFNKICEEFDAAPDDYAWDEGHPIFNLAQENDELKKRLPILTAEVNTSRRDYNVMFSMHNGLEQQLTETQQALADSKAREEKLREVIKSPCDLSRFEFSSKRPNEAMVVAVEWYENL